VLTVCAAFNPVSVAEDSRVWDVTSLWARWLEGL